MDEKNKRFHYSYSASQQEEIQQIRKKYMPAQEDKMEQLRRLDRQSTQKATVISLLAGILGSLLLGLGMSCAMVWGGAWFVPGVAIGIIGIALVCAAYPLYHHVSEKERQKIAPQILQLIEELTQQ